MVDLINALAGGMPKQNTLANTLQAMGAGFQGRGNEYQALQMSKRDKEEERLQKRKMLAAKDIQQVSKLLQSGNIDGANKLMENRVSAITRQGQDPSDTLEFMKLLKNDPVQALKDSQGIVEESYNRGLLERPEPPKIENDLSRGVQVVTFPDGRTEIRPLGEIPLTPEQDLARQKFNVEQQQYDQDMSQRMQENAQENMQFFSELGMDNRKLALEEQKFQQELNEAQQSGGVKLTGEEQKTVLLGNRMVNADKIMDDLVENGYNPVNVRDMAALKAGNTALLSREGQLYYNAGQQYITGLLRKETGAAVTETEWAKYIPMILPSFGDTSKTLEQKRKSRKQNINSFASSLGGGKKTDLMYGRGESKGQGATSNTGGNSALQKAREELARRQASGG